MRALIILLLFSLSAAAALAANIDLTDDPMMIGGGARPLGMGRAFTAVVEDADAAFINPAGSANLRGPQAMSMFTNLLGEIYYVELCGGIPTLYGTFGAGYVATGINNVLYPASTGNVNADYYDHLFLLSYSAPLALFWITAAMFLWGRTSSFLTGAGPAVTMILPLATAPISASRLSFPRA